MNKDIFATLKIATMAWFTYISKRHIASVLLSRNFAYAKFREIKTLAKVSEFTVFKVKKKAKIMI